MAKNRLLAYRGQQFTIEWARDANGTARAKEFFDHLKPKDQAKVMALFRRLGETGRIDNQKQFKKLGPNLWEFKSFQIRLLGDFRPGGRFLVVLGLKKKRDRHKAKDLDIAQEILGLH